MATYRPFDPFYGEGIVVILFVIVILGGLGSITGAVIGGLIIGVIQQMSTLVVSVSLQNVAVFAIFLLCLYFRPQGIMGKKGACHMSARARRPRSGKDFLGIVAVCIISLLVSWIAGPDRYAQRLILLVLLWASMSSGFNLISGYGGQVVFGYMLFVGTGAYTTVMLFKLFHVSPWIGMWAGALLAVAIAFVIGLPTLRLRGHYFAVATVAFPLMAFPILNHWGLEEVTIPFTGQGALAFQFGDLRYYVVAAIILLAGVLLLIKTIAVFPSRLCPERSQAE